LLPQSFPTSSFLWVLVALGAMDLSFQRYLQSCLLSTSHLINLHTDGDKCGLLHICHRKDADSKSEVHWDISESHGWLCGTRRYLVRASKRWSRTCLTNQLCGNRHLGSVWGKQCRSWYKKNRNPDSKPYLWAGMVRFLNLEREPTGPQQILTKINSVALILQDDAGHSLRRLPTWVARRQPLCVYRKWKGWSWLSEGRQRETESHHVVYQEQRCSVEALSQQRSFSSKTNRWENLQNRVAIIAIIKTRF